MEKNYQLHFPQVYPREKNLRCPLDRRLGWPQEPACTLWRREKYLARNGNWTSVVHSYPSCYTDWPIPTHNNLIPTSQETHWYSLQKNPGLLWESSLFVHIIVIVVREMSAHVLVTVLILPAGGSANKSPSCRQLSSSSKCLFRRDSWNLNLVYLQYLMQWLDCDYAELLVKSINTFCGWSAEFCKC
jgi:hypothetical protein